MKPIYERSFSVSAAATDCFGRMKPSQILMLLQEMAGDHSALLGTARDQLIRKGMFWAVIRHRVQITRLPTTGETLTAQTWPMPTTRTAYPRSTVVYDAQGNECFRSISLWVLMDAGSRAMVLPGKSGVAVEGALMGNELAAPGSLALRPLANQTQRTVRFTDLDINGHMNNCRYLDWVCDTLPGQFHREHPMAEFTVCYLSEAREGENLSLCWELGEDGCLTVDAVRPESSSSTGHARVFSARVLFENGVL